MMVFISRRDAEAQRGIESKKALITNSTLLLLSATLRLCVINIFNLRHYYDCIYSTNSTANTSRMAATE
ncbi:hypothetical protein NIES25_41040 [Nostoc linckia NIES-25]|nr:hypothetical protein NIES25_41040 [Nostoc linckia NIES-25]